VETYFLPAREVVPATPRTRIITIDLDAQAFSFRAGQAVFAGLAEGAWKRPYSIACSPGQARRTNAIELLVQTDDHRAPDPHLERVTAGTALRIEGPFGTFGVNQPLIEPRLLLIAGGTGIAPLRAILWDTLEQRSAVDLHVIYSARSPGEFAYRDELASLDRARHITLSLTATRATDDVWPGTRGRIDRSLIRSSVEPGQTRAVVCGPPGFVANVVTLLHDSGVPPGHIVTESYIG
jgi:ferredoxin-NADP reductase